MEKLEKQINSFKSKNVAAFKKAISYTLATSFYFIAPVAFILTPIDNKTTNMFLLLASNITVIIVPLLNSLDTRRISENETLINPFRPRTWARLQDNISLKLITKELHKITKKLRNGISEQELVKFYVLSKLNNWRNYSGTELSDIVDAIENKVHQFNYRPLIIELFKKESNHFSLSYINRKYSDTAANFLLKHGYELKEKDYKIISKEILNLNTDIVDTLIASDNSSIDWIRIKNIFSDYPSTRNFEHYNNKILHIIEKKQLIDNNTQIIQNLHSEKAEQTIKSVELPEFLKYQPSQYVQLWNSLVNQYKDIYKNKHILNAHELQEFHLQIESVLPAIIKADNYLSNISSENANRKMLSNKLKSNLEDMNHCCEQIIANIEYNMLQQLEVNTKYLKVNKG